MYNHIKIMITLIVYGVILQVSISSYAKDKEPKNLFDALYSQFGIGGHGPEDGAIPIFNHHDGIHIIVKPQDSDFPDGRTNKPDKWYIFVDEAPVPIEVTWEGIGDVEKLVVIDLFSERICDEPTRKKFPIVKAVLTPEAGARRVQIPIHRPYARPYEDIDGCPQDFVIKVYLKTRAGQYFSNLAHYFSCAKIPGES